MSKRDLKGILSKYLNNQASEFEIEQLLEWLKKEQNLKLFNDYIAVDHYLNTKYKKVDSVDAYKKAMALYDRKRRKAFYKYAVAASVALLVSLTVFFNQTEKNNSDVLPIIVNNTIETGTDKATLTLEDGTDITLEKGQQYIADNLESNGEEIIYKTISSPKPEITYNYLTIPRGGQYHVKLADGTEVWLNSESQLKYPTTFIDGKERKVELVYGEAYFDVSPSTKHKGSKFKVINNAQEIEVLGTEFNIRAYKKENNVYTTLVEGKVTVTNEKQKETLIPNQQAVINSTSNEININTVTDLHSIIGWKNGVFSFKEMPLNKIMKVLSRWYDIDVIFTNETVKSEKFTGVLGKEQTIEDILLTIYNTNNILYEINNKRIIFR